VLSLTVSSTDDKIKKLRKKMGGNRKKNFAEGWVEFMNKKVAKNVAECLNNNIIGIETIAPLALSLSVTFLCEFRREEGWVLSRRYMEHKVSPKVQVASFDRTYW
jgi:hypothetical protein